jgi:hypothetical protein
MEDRVNLKILIEMESNFSIALTRHALASREALGLGYRSSQPLFMSMVEGLHCAKERSAV